MLKHFISFDISEEETPEVETSTDLIDPPAVSKRKQRDEIENRSRHRRFTERLRENMHPKPRTARVPLASRLRSSPSDQALLTAWCSASVALLRVVGIVVVGEYLPSAALVERRAHKSTHPLRPGNPGQRGKIKYESGNCRAFS